MANTNTLTSAPQRYTFTWPLSHRMRTHPSDGPPCQRHILMRLCKPLSQELSTKPARSSPALHLHLPRPYMHTSAGPIAVTVPILPLPPSCSPHFQFSPRSIRKPTEAASCSMQHATLHRGIHNIVNGSTRAVAWSTFSAGGRLASIALPPCLLRNLQHTSSHRPLAALPNAAGTEVTKALTALTVWPCWWWGCCSPAAGTRWPQAARHCSPAPWA